MLVSFLLHFQKNINKVGRRRASRLFLMFESVAFCFEHFGLSDVWICNVFSINLLVYLFILLFDLN